VGEGVKVGVSEVTGSFSGVSSGLFDTSMVSLVEVAVTISVAVGKIATWTDVGLGPLRT